MFQADLELLTVCCSIYFKLHIRMLASKYVIVVENILSEMAFNCIFSSSDGLSLMQALVAQGAPVNFVYMDKSFILDYQLKVI